jgi:hypothetical protein
MVTNDVSDYINLLLRVAHIICNHAFADTVARSRQRRIVA